MAATAVSGFYESYKERVKNEKGLPNIMPRDAVQILTQMGSQTLIICERRESPREKTIVAGSVLWETEVPVPSASSTAVRGFDVETYWEFGTQVSDLNGHAFQWMMTAITLLERLTLDGNGILIAATYGDNVRAANNFLSTMRFVEWTDVPPTLDSIRWNHLKADKQESRGVRWFRPTLQTVIDAAGLMVDLCRSPVRKAPRQVIGSAVNEIEIQFDQQTFRLVSFSDMLNTAELIIKAQPTDLVSLRVAVQNRSVSETFLYWPPKE